MTSSFRTYAYPLSDADRAEIEMRARAARAEASKAFFRAIGQGIAGAVRWGYRTATVSQRARRDEAAGSSARPRAQSWSPAAPVSLP